MNTILRKGDSFITFCIGIYLDPTIIFIYLAIPTLYAASDGDTHIITLLENGCKICESSYNEGVTEHREALLNNDVEKAAAKSKTLCNSIAYNAFQKQL